MIPLLGAHISDGVLQREPQIVGLLATCTLVAIAVRKLKDEELPRIVLCTAFFFVASQIHVPVGPTSVHLLLNSLLGLLLGFKAVIPIATGLFMQAVLFGHGGYLVWGVNCLIFLLPALAAPMVFRWLRLTASPGGPSALPFALSIGYLLAPITLFPIWIAGQRMRLCFEDGSLFRTAFLTGFLGVMGTVFLNALVLIAFGSADWRVVAFLVIACHIPIAFIEGAILGFVIEALATSGQRWQELPIELDG